MDFSTDGRASINDSDYIEEIDRRRGIDWERWNSWIGIERSGRVDWGGHNALRHWSDLIAS